MALEHCDHCKNMRWLYQGEPHIGGDERCPKCNPICRTCWDEMQVEVPWSDDLERGPSYMPCPDCSDTPASPPQDGEGGAE